MLGPRERATYCGTILKHTETNKEDAQGAAGNTKLNANVDELTRKGRTAMADLEVIASYMVDFASIVEESADLRRSKK